MSAFKDLALGLVEIKMRGGESEDFRRAAKSAELLLVSDIAPSTGKNYAPYWCKFKTFCESNHRAFLPAEVDMVVVYLSVLARGGTLGPVKMARAAIRYFHVKHGGVSPTYDSKVAQLLVALKRKLGKPVVKRAPINSEILLALVKHFLPEGVESTENLLNFKWACLFLIQYFASARFEEAIHLNIGDIIFTPDSNVLVTFR